ncbi:MAG: hypothetical protein SFW07_07830 [Gammaproteobacteria bacterium]|nr:hypothetical protein [Gammaproteobacteria bacterium]
MNARSHQKGFLAIVAIAVVVIVAFIAVTATYQYAGDSLSSAAHLRSAQAFQIAQAGIEQAKYNIVTQGNTCSGYSSGTVSFTPPSGSGAGQYLVTGTTSSATSTLNGALTNSATTIPVVSTSGYTSPGAFQIDSEVIYYSGISGNTFTGVVRGINGTTAAAHSSGAIVQQNECFITSTAGIPTINSANGKRILTALIVGTSFGFNVGGNFVIPTMGGSGSFDMQGSSVVQNPGVTLNGPGFPASNIITSSTINWTGNNAQTQVSGGTQASNRNNELSDIQENTTLFNSGNFTSQYFNQTTTELRNNAISNGWLYSSGSSINGLSGRVIYYDGNLDLTGNQTIGTVANPVLLIVNGNFDMRGNVDIVGFVFVLGTSDVGGNTTITGSFASAGNAQLYGNTQVTLNQQVLNSVNQITGNMNTRYSSNAITLQEQFQ